LKDNVRVTGRTGLPTLSAAGDHCGQFSRHSLDAV
jgi:hypothetical protein